MPKKMKKWTGWGLWPTFDGMPHIFPYDWTRAEVARWCQTKSIRNVIRITITEIRPKRKGAKR